MAFTSETFTFLTQLKKNNNRDWFNKNKDRYEALVREPSLEFIESAAAPLKKISEHFVAIPKKMGGSLMRVYRDTRFSKDKTPYKTNIGIHFRHEFGKNVHAPGYYLHIAPGETFLGLGIWHPDSDALKKIRSYMQEEPTRWKRAINAKTFKDTFELAGASLKKAPLGIEKDHPMIDDLKRKDFIGVTTLGEDTILSNDLLKTVSEHFKKGNNLMRFLCDALRVPF